MITTAQHQFTAENGWEDLKDNLSGTPQLVLAFGSTELVKDSLIFKYLKDLYPKSEIVSVSTAGEIMGAEVFDETVSVTALHFEKTRIKLLSANIETPLESHKIAKDLIEKLENQEENLEHILTFTDGEHINGTSFVEGIQEAHKDFGTVITGGLAGDGNRFENTAIGVNKEGETGNIVMIGFYGKSLKVGYGSEAGWNAFGIKREITKSKGNVLYELDGKPALDIYKKYLGEHAKDLPSSGLLFPLELCIDCEEVSGKNVKLVRTTLSVDEEAKSLTFAGNMPEGVRVRMMKANFERLINGAEHSAVQSLRGLDGELPDFSLLISCVGRKLVLKKRTEDELEVIQDKMGEKTTITGFYAYGELCPVTDRNEETKADEICQLHNQTMTITNFKEI